MLSSGLWRDRGCRVLGVLIVLLLQNSGFAQDTPSSTTAQPVSRKVIRDLGSACGPDCLLCSTWSSPLDRSAAMCKHCKPGYDFNTNLECERIICQVPHCLKCRDTGMQGCFQCLPGYVLTDGRCLDQFDLIYRNAQASSLGDSSYHDDYGDDDAVGGFGVHRLIFAGFIFLPCLVLYILRTLQRRQRSVPVEILLRRVPPIAITATPSDRRQEGAVTEDARPEEAESAPLLSSSGGEAAKASTAVLVVDPRGNIEVGVQQEQSDPGRDQEP